MKHVNASEDNTGGLPQSPTYYGEQDENGVDLSLIRENLRLSPTERVRRADKARRDALRLLEYGRRNREKRS
ncbi:MAG: hypothetical protein ACYSUQ_02725 [Planctomycetota bacterium]|jgi:hypothetical protein